MLSSLNSERLKPLNLVPLVYMVGTRFTTARDLGYLAASSWIPAIWLVIRLGGHPPGEALLLFAGGYLCFVSLHEIGYLINDSWSPPGTTAARMRLKFRYGPGYLASFVAIRLALWTGLAVLFGWIGEPVWLAAFAAHVAAFTLHLTVPVAAYKLASQFQLATLRFAIPVIGGIAAAQVPVLLLAALLFYTYFRLLSYMDGKSMILMPERRGPGFAPIQIVMLSPLALLAAVAVGETVLVELAVYFAAVYGLAAAIDRR